MRLQHVPSPPHICSQPCGYLRFGLLIGWPHPTMTRWLVIVLTLVVCSLPRALKLRYRVVNITVEAQGSRCGFAYGETLFNE